MRITAKLDSIAWIKGLEHKAIRLNILLYFTGMTEPMAIKGVRIRDGYIQLPVHTKGRVEYPVLGLPPEIGEVVVEAVLRSHLLRTDFPDIFPLMSREILVRGLEFDKKFALRDFPGTLGDM